MTKHIIETVTFKLNDGVEHADFVKAAQDFNAFVLSRQGFIARRLSCGEDGTWIEHIEWETMDAAQAAAEAIGTDPANQPFLSAIDGPSAKMFHTELEISLE